MKRRSLTVLLVLALLLAGCGGQTPADQSDPYAGMVSVSSGYGTEMWVDLHDNVPVNTLAAEDFAREDGRIVYTGGEVPVSRGIDVSEHQGEIDWAAVAADGVDFAIIRAGYRGYSEGGLFEDKFFQHNVNGAVENGIPMGLYFFSQATDAKEAEEEAAFLLERLERYVPETFTLPIFYDWETIGVEAARTDDVSAKTVTACARAFCRKLESAGYTAGVYAYRYLGYFTYDLSKLADYPLWMGAVGEYPDFFYRHNIWQYSITGRVDGIAGDVDMNLRFHWDAQPEDTAFGSLLVLLPGSGHFAALDAADSAELETLLNSDRWAGTEDCGCPGRQFYQSGQRLLRYCPDCGAFRWGNQALVLTKREQKTVDKLWERLNGAP